MRPGAGCGVPMRLRFEIFPSDLDATVDFYSRLLVDTAGLPGLLAGRA